MNVNKSNYFILKEEASNQKRSLNDLLEDIKYNSIVKAQCLDLLSKRSQDLDLLSLNNCYKKAIEALEIRENIMNQIEHGKF